MNWQALVIMVYITVQDKGTFLKTYGVHTLRSTLQSLRDTGRPLATWCGVVFGKEVSISVTRLSGTTKEYCNIKLEQTVSQLKELVACDLFGNSFTEDLELVYGHSILSDKETLSQAGIQDGACLQVIETDSMPDLASESDSE